MWPRIAAAPFDPCPPPPEKKIKSKPSLCPACHAARLPSPVSGSSLFLFAFFPSRPFLSFRPSLISIYDPLSTHQRERFSARARARRSAREVKHCLVPAMVGGG